MGNFFAFLIAALVTVFFMRGYLSSLKKKEERARAAAEKGKLFSEGPKAQHPHIDTAYCIGCGTCTAVCPEGDVLAMIGGKAAIVNGFKCIGHGLCAEACPVGAITMVMAGPSIGANMPYLTPEYETSLHNLFVVGELGGLALIKNAVNQGRACVDTIASRMAAQGPGRSDPGIYDVLIAGAGPAGISASLRAIEHKLRYITIEQDEVGGTVAKYPRQKLVMTSPVEFPMYGKFKSTELSKEKLLAFWDKVLHRADFKIRSGEKVDDIRREADGLYTIVTSKNQYRSRAVVLALGRTGTPRKLGAKGEDLPKVMYRLIEADHYVNKKILVVGGGDSAVEAAMGLAHQKGNEVTLSYRQEQFSRIKERNTQRLAECTRNGKLKLVMSSNVKEIREGSVLLDVKGEMRELANDYVWIFAGGTPPYDFLKKIGVQFGSRDLTSEVGEEAKEEAAFKADTAVGKPATADVESAVGRLGVSGEELPKVAYELPQSVTCSDKDILVVGSGDLAIRSALTLARARRNRVTLSYRGDHFQRAGARSRQLLEAAEREGAVRVLRNAEVLAITSDSVVVAVSGNPAEIPNDLVFILIGDEMPQQFKYNVGMGVPQLAT